MNRRRATLAISTVCVAGTLSSCGMGSTTGTGTGSSAAAGLGVAAAFYPLQFAAEQIGGDKVTVTNLTKPGTEPHDLELTPREVAGLADTKVIIFEKGFQPAVDDAVAQLGGSAGFDVSPAANLTLASTENGHDHTDEHDQAGAAKDPHFWLDPTRYAKVATAIGDKFAAADPANAATYHDNATAFVAKLTKLDTEFKSGLANCAIKDLVTGHSAFAYLADRYGFHQEGIAGVSPDAEPDAATMQSLVSHVKESKATTVYAETLVSPALAETIARESGAKVAVLDPLEGITDASAGTDYFAVMKVNLETLKAGQSCT